jgi:hypothetical protein
MKTRLLVAVVGIAATLVVSPLDAEAVPPVGDSVTGTGTVELLVDGLPEPVVTPFAIDAMLNPGGKKAKGQVSMSELFAEAPVRCLELRALSEEEFVEATMNIETDELGLVTLQISNGNPEGLPDFFSVLTSSPRSPKDCSRLAFGAENLRGFVVTGDVDFVNV